MIKINYYQFITEQFNDDPNFLNKRIAGTAAKASELGVTIQTHDGTELQFMQGDTPESLHVREWRPGAVGKILIGGVKVMHKSDAFKLAGNRAVPEHQTKVPEYFRPFDSQGYVADYFKSREKR